MSGHESTYEPKTGIEKWIDARLPVPRLVYDSFVDFPTPKNLNYWWTFGGILAIFLAIQIATGVVLAMHYTATTADAAPASAGSASHGEQLPAAESRAAPVANTSEGRSHAARSRPTAHWSKSSRATPIG